MSGKRRAQPQQRLPHPGQGCDSQAQHHGLEMLSVPAVHLLSPILLACVDPSLSTAAFEFDSHSCIPAAHLLTLPTFLSMQDSRGRKRLRSARGAAGSGDAGAGHIAGADAAATSAPSPFSAPPLFDAVAAAPDVAPSPSLTPPEDATGRGKRSKRRATAGGAAAADALPPPSSSSLSMAHTEQAALPDVPQLPPTLSVADAAGDAAAGDEGPISPMPHHGEGETLMLPSHLSSSFTAGQSVPQSPSFQAQARGYLAYFYWSHYPSATSPSSTFRPPKRSPTHTELVPSIPTIFFRIFSILSDAFHASHQRALYPLMDKKLLKPTGHTLPAPPAPYVPGHPLPPTSHLDPHSIPVEALDATRLLLRDQHGAEYIVTACRKEHVKLLYEGEAAVLGRAGLCNLLVDVYAVQGGKKVLVGGAGMDRRGDRSGAWGWECRCASSSAALLHESKGDVESEPVVEEKVAEAEADAVMQDEPSTAVLSPDAAVADGGPSADGRRRVHLALPEEAPALSAATSSTSASSGFVRPVPAEMLELPPLGEPLDDVDELLLASELPHALTPSSSTATALPSSSPPYQQPPHILTPTHPSSASSHGQTLHSQHAAELERERSRKKMAALQRQLMTAQDQLKSVTAMCQLWESKYKGTTDHKPAPSPARPSTTALRSPLPVLCCAAAVAVNGAVIGTAHCPMCTATAADAAPVCPLSSCCALLVGGEGRQQSSQPHTATPSYPD